MRCTAAIEAVVGVHPGIIRRVCAAIDWPSTETRAGTRSPLGVQDVERDVCLRQVVSPHLRATTVVRAPTDGSWTTRLVLPFSLLM